MSNQFVESWKLNQSNSRAAYALPVLDPNPEACLNDPMTAAHERSLHTSLESCSNSQLLLFETLISLLIAGTPSHLLTSTQVIKDLAPILPMHAVHFGREHTDGTHQFFPTSSRVSGPG